MNTLKNKVNLIGRIGAKPEEKVFESGARRTTLNLAINDSYKNKAGEWVDNTQWHTIVAWGKNVERVIKLLDKGSEVLIEGKLVNRSYEDKSGVKRTVTEIELNEFVLVNKKPQTI